MNDSHKNQELSNILKPDSLDLELLEWAVFHETNVQRERLGLKPFEYEYKLQEGAGLHSQEIVAVGYFNHHSPVAHNETVRSRLMNAGISRGIGGEDIAIHPAGKRQDIVFRFSDWREQQRRGWRNEGESSYLRRVCRRSCAALAQQCGPPPEHPQ